MNLKSVWSTVLPRGSVDAIAPTRRFDLLRWFSLISFVLISAIAFGLGSISTRFLINESLERDALLSAQFIQSLAKGEVRHHGLSGMRMGDILAPVDYAMLAPDIAQNRLRARSEFFDHLANLPDTLLINIYSPQLRVIWSSNPQLIGHRIDDDPALDATFSAREPVLVRYSELNEQRPEQKFLREPQMFYIENYIPLSDDRGNILAVVEIYKEPVDLIERVDRGYAWIWLSTAVGGLLLYFGLFWIVRRAAMQLAAQENQLVANKTYVGLVEMSSAVAHNLRNPLAVIRSSAELAHDTPGQPAKNNIGDIIGQVDRMAGWVHDLLVCLRPLRGEPQPLAPLPIVQTALTQFSQQLTLAQVRVEFKPEPLPLIISHPLLLSQILNSVIANAMEAMHGGGTLSISARLDKSRQWLDLIIADSGDGMSRQEELLAFKSFYTTRQGRLGIGLVMVKQIMQSFGGEVWLSTFEQQGTSVCLRFKVAQ
jgi:two-component system sensor histidine kinase HydH